MFSEALSCRFGLVALRGAAFGGVAADAVLCRFGARVVAASVLARAPGAPDTSPSFETKSATLASSLSLT